MKKFKNQAFTLVELVVVMVIIGLLFVFLIPKINFATNLAKESGVKNTLHSYQVAITSAMNENAGLETLDAGKTPVSVINEYLDPALKISDTGVINYLDPWNEPYVYQYADNTVRIYSNGSSATADSDIAYADGTQISLVVKFAEGKVLSGTTGLSKNTSDGLTTAEVESAIAELAGTEPGASAPTDAKIAISDNTVTFSANNATSYKIYFNQMQHNPESPWEIINVSGSTATMTLGNDGLVTFSSGDTSHLLEVDSAGLYVIAKNSAGSVKSGKYTLTYAGVLSTGGDFEFYNDPNENPEGQSGTPIISMQGTRMFVSCTGASSMRVYFNQMIDNPGSDWTYITLNGSSSQSSGYTLGDYSYTFSSGTLNALENFTAGIYVEATVGADKVKSAKYTLLNNVIASNGSYEYQESSPSGSSTPSISIESSRMVVACTGATSMKLIFDNVLEIENNNPEWYTINLNASGETSDTVSNGSYKFTNGTVEVLSLANTAVYIEAVVNGIKVYSPKYVVTFDGQITANGTYDYSV